MEEKANGGKDGKKAGLIRRAWERCRSMKVSKSPPIADTEVGPGARTSSWPRLRRPRREKASPVAPVGCFTVYVGPKRERFVVRTERLNHPLLRELLEEAEAEYGFAVAGPLELPCDVEVFERVLWEMEQEDIDGEDVNRVAVFATPCHCHAGYQLLSPARPKLKWLISPARTPLTTRAR